MSILKSDKILNIRGVRKEDGNLVGGKGANLGELCSFGMPVPEAFCVTTNAYDAFLQEAELQPKIEVLLHDLDMEDTDKLEQLSDKIKELFLQAEFPAELKEAILKSYTEGKYQEVSVRSSAVAEDLEGASFAGQHDTYLNVTEEELLLSIKKCFASLFTARVLLYRHDKGFSLANVKIAVVIQEMVEAKYAGVIFTINPVNKNRDEAVIEVVEGLGEKLVSGEVTPTTYILRKADYSITVQQEMEAKLSAEQRKELIEYGTKIEEHYGKPMDIEFAIDAENKVLILQARAVTA